MTSIRENQVSTNIAKRREIVLALRMSGYSYRAIANAIQAEINRIGNNYSIDGVRMMIKRAHRMEDVNAIIESIKHDDYGEFDYLMFQDSGSRLIVVRLNSDDYDKLLVNVAILNECGLSLAETTIDSMKPYTDNT